MAYIIMWDDSYSLDNADRVVGKRALRKAIADIRAAGGYNIRWEAEEDLLDGWDE